MQSFIIRGGLAAAAVIAIAVTATPQLRAQNAAALAANPELAAKGVWDETVTYAKEDIVTARGSTWISLRANNKNRVPGQTQPSTAIYWQLFARGFNPSGAWVNSTKYQPDDLVTHNGQTYRARITNTNRQPPHAPSWELLVAKGADGAPGSQGLQGEQGIQGPPGPNTGVSAGTANAPAISFAGDANTGIYSPADDKIALVENGQLLLHSTGTFNTGVGPRALSANTTGASNTAVGSDALLSNTTGSNNTAVGLAALLSNTVSSDNTALGSNALRDSNGSGAVTGSGNTAVGSNALAENAIGRVNVAVGHLALSKNTTGNGNTAIGASALQNNTTGILNTALGNGALFSNTTAARNMGIGRLALFANNGTENTALGDSALESNNGSGNIAIGLHAGLNPTFSNNSIFIGNAGEVGDDTTIKIGVKNSQSTTFISGIRGITTLQNDAVAVLIDSEGQLGTVSSSRRYKDDIETMADVSAMLATLRPVTFRYKAPYADGGKPIQYGLIAEEVAEILPDLAVFNAAGQPETVKYHLLPSFLLAGYQAQQNTIAAQAEEIARLKERVAANEALEERLRRIEALLPHTKAAALQ